MKESELYGKGFPCVHLSEFDLPVILVLAKADLKLLRHAVEINDFAFVKLAEGGPVSGME